MMVDKGDNKEANKVNKKNNKVYKDANKVEKKNNKVYKEAKLVEKEDNKEATEVTNEVMSYS